MPAGFIFFLGQHSEQTGKSTHDFETRHLKHKRQRQCRKRNRLVNGPSKSHLFQDYTYYSWLKHVGKRHEIGLHWILLLQLWLFELQLRDDPMTVFGIHSNFKRQGSSRSSHSKCLLVDFSSCCLHTMDFGRRRSRTHDCRTKHRVNVVVGNCDSTPPFPSLLLLVNMPLRVRS